MAEREPRACCALRERLRDGLHDELDEIYINGSMEHRLPHNLNISFAYVEGEALLMGINDVAVSSGSACTSASLEPSYVLKALGVGDELAHSSIRFGLGRFNTEEEVDYVVDKVIGKVNQLREMSPLYEMAKEGVDLSRACSGRLTEAAFGDRHDRTKQTWLTAKKSSTTTRTRATSGRFDKDDPNVGHRPGRRAGVRRRDEAAGQGQPTTGVIDDAKFKTFGCGSAIAQLVAWRPSGSRARRSTRRWRSRTPTSSTS